MFIPTPKGFMSREGAFSGQFNFETISCRRELARQLRENRNNQLLEAHARVQEQREQERRRRRPKQGVTRLSNIDSIGRAQQIRSRLLAKLTEIAGSDLEPRARDALIADIKMQLDRVDQKVMAIRRRQRAIEAEKNARRETDTPEERRRRFRDMQERRIYIRRDFLYHADEGGFNPNNPFGMKFIQAPNAPVSLDMGGTSVGLDLAASMPTSEIVL